MMHRSTSRTTSATGIDRLAGPTKLSTICCKEPATNNRCNSSRRTNRSIR